MGAVLKRECETRLFSLKDKYYRAKKQPWHTYTKCETKLAGGGEGQERLHLFVCLLAPSAYCSSAI
jgi:hypothetical protein